MSTKDLTQEQLKNILSYNADTGEFYWLINANYNAQAGQRAGALVNKYIGIRIKGVMHQAHRLAWLYMTGKHPNRYIDHVNVIKTDNKFINLRESTPSQNCMNYGKKSNNTSNYKGVSFHKASNKWQALCRHDGIQKHIGLFLTAELASEAYKSYSKIHQKEFSNS